MKIWRSKTKNTTVHNVHIPEGFNLHWNPVLRRTLHTWASDNIKFWRSKTKNTNVHNVHIWYPCQEEVSTCTETWCCNGCYTRGARNYNANAHCYQRTKQKEYYETMSKALLLYCSDSRKPFKLKDESDGDAKDYCHESREQIRILRAKYRMAHTHECIMAQKATCQRRCARMHMLNDSKWHMRCAG